MAVTHKKKKVIVFIILLMLAVYPVLADIPGSEPLASGYSQDGLSYEDETITVSITQGRTNKTDYWVARIKLSDPGQIRTTSAKGFDSNRTMRGLILAERMNAVLAVNGDYFSYIPDGHLIRNGVMYRDLPSGKRDVLLIDDRGDFYQIPLATREDIEAFSGNSLVNSFNFGPSLVIDGTRVKEYKDNNNAAFQPRQRMAIAQVKRGSLEYITVACAGPKGDNIGMTLDQFSRLVFEQGVENAYNLDGGYSTMLMFNGACVNNSDLNNIREISDIIYFVSIHDSEEASGFGE